MHCYHIITEIEEEIGGGCRKVVAIRPNSPEEGIENCLPHRRCDLFGGELGMSMSDISALICTCLRSIVKCVVTGNEYNYNDGEGDKRKQVINSHSR